MQAADPKRAWHRVFVAENSPLIRQRLVAMLDAVEGVRVIGEADTPRAAIDGILRTRPDSVVLDLQLSGGSGIQVLREVHAQLPGSIFIVLTHFGTPQYRRACMDAGASHFLDKAHTADVRDIIAARQAATPDSAARPPSPFACTERPTP